MATTSTCKTTESHCENCGSTSGEDVGWNAARENDGYSACCNELIVTADTCRGHHLEG